MNLHQHNFVTEYLRTGDNIQSYKNAYSSDSTNYHSLESAANRLLRNPEIAKAISDTQNAIRQQVKEELKAELKQELLTVQKKRELLAQIATGEMYTEQNYRGKNCSQCTQFVKPTINQMLKAIDLDNKLAGHYSQQRKKEPVHPVRVTMQRQALPTIPENKKIKMPLSQQNTTTLSNDKAISEPQLGSTVAPSLNQSNTDTDGVIRYRRLFFPSFFLRKKKEEKLNNGVQIGETGIRQYSIPLKKQTPKAEITTIHNKKRRLYQCISPLAG